MILQADELISFLNEKYKALISNICLLEKSCVKKRRCNAEQTIPLLNFDKIKDIHCKGQSPVASVDGLLEKYGVLCFVELKSWKNYLTYQYPNDENDILDKLKSYALEEKLTKSMLICCEEAKNDNLFNKIPVAFILVTDIEIEKEGEWSISENLTRLAHSSSDWNSVCNRITQEKLNEMNVKTAYFNCSEFDDKLNSFILLLIENDGFC